MNPRKPGNQNSLESAMVKSPNSLENSFKISINLSCLEHYGNNLDLVVDLARVEEKVQQWTWKPAKMGGKKKESYMVYYRIDVNNYINGIKKRTYNT